MGIGINFELNWDCITLRYMENNTQALRVFEEYIFLFLRFSLIILLD